MITIRVIKRQNYMIKKGQQPFNDMRKRNGKILTRHYMRWKMEQMGFVAFVVNRFHMKDCLRSLQQIHVWNIVKIKQMYQYRRNGNLLGRWIFSLLSNDM